MMRQFSLALAAALIFVLSDCLPNAHGQSLYSVSPQSNLLRRVEPATGATLSSVPMTREGNPINGAIGLAAHPETHQLWAILSDGFTALATVDPESGVVDIVGGVGDRVVALAFNESAELFAIGGPDSNSSNRRTLFQLDLSTGRPNSEIFMFPTDGPHTLGFDPGSDLLFRASGRAGSPGLESLDLNSLELAQVPLSSDWEGEARGMTFVGGGDFLLASGFRDNQGGNEFLYRLSTDGTPTLIGPLDHRAKGLAWVVPEPSALVLLIAGLFVVVQSRHIRAG